MTRIRKPPTTLSVARATGQVTFSEIIRDKILYNVLLCAFLLFAVSWGVSRLTFIRPERMVLDLGLTGLSLSCSMIAIFAGAGLISKEFDRRTVYIAFSHPITKSQFLLGKYLGLAAVVTVNWFLLSLVYLVILALVAGNFGDFSFTLLMGIFLVWIQGLLISSQVFLFSSFSTPSLTAILTIGLYLLGYNISQMKMISAECPQGLMKMILNTFAATLPNLEYFNLGLKVTYGLPVSVGYVLTSTLYGICLSGLFLLLAGILIGYREI